MFSEHERNSTVHMDNEWYFLLEMLIQIDSILFEMFRRDGTCMQDASGWTVQIQEINVVFVVYYSKHWKMCFVRDYGSYLFFCCQGEHLLSRLNICKNERYNLKIVSSVGILVFIQIKTQHIFREFELQ